MYGRHTWNIPLSAVNDGVLNASHLWFPIHLLNSLFDKSFVWVADL